MKKPSKSPNGKKNQDKAAGMPMMKGMGGKGGKMGKKKAMRGY